MVKIKFQTKQEVLNAFRHAVGAKQAFSDMVNGKISKKEFEAKGYKLAKLNQYASIFIS